MLNIAEEWVVVNKKPLGSGGQGSAYLVKNMKKFDALTDKYVREVSEILCELKSHARSRASDIDWYSATHMMFRNILHYTSTDISSCLGVLKQLNNIDDSKARKRMAKEIYVLEENDDHPNVMRILCSEPSMTPRWFISAYYPEGSLEKKQNRKQYTDNVEKSLIAFGGLVSGIQRLHKHKVAHRDIKPDNILCDQGKLIIGDMGLVLLHQRDDFRVTGSNESVGTRNWQPTFQESAPYKELDAMFTDVFALVKILWFMLADPEAKVMKLCKWDEEGDWADQNLKVMHPHNEDLKYLDDIFKLCLVEEKSRLRIDIDVLEMLVDHALEKVRTKRRIFKSCHGKHVNQCRVCKTGFYVIKLETEDLRGPKSSTSKNFGVYEDHLKNEWLMEACSHCGHANWFLCEDKGLPEGWAIEYLHYKKPKMLKSISSFMTSLDKRYTENEVTLKGALNKIVDECQSEAPNDLDLIRYLSSIRFEIKNKDKLLKKMVDDVEKTEMYINELLLLS